MITEEERARNTERFCQMCGEELINDKVRGYDKYTGEKLFIKVCPTGRCDHTGISHDDGGFWSSACSKCGEKMGYIYF